MPDHDTKRCVFAAQSVSMRMMNHHTTRVLPVGSGGLPWTINYGPMHGVGTGLGLTAPMQPSTILLEVAVDIVREGAHSSGRNRPPQAVRSLPDYSRKANVNTSLSFGHTLRLPPAPW